MMLLDFVVVVFFVVVVNVVVVFLMGDFFLIDFLSLFFFSALSLSFASNLYFLDIKIQKIFHVRFNVFAFAYSAQINSHETSFCDRFFANGRESHSFVRQAKNV